MSKESIKQWIIDWFVANTAFLMEEISAKLENSYFEEGWLDSFAFINFVTDIEENFNISFSNDEFQNRAFSTISGLTDIIWEQING